MKDSEKKIDRTQIIKELEDRLLKKWKADKSHTHSALPADKPAYLKTINNKINKK
ncbi:MAG: hypothetical protein ACSLE0_19865 [Chitinophagaceae bacterium]